MKKDFEIQIIVSGQLGEEVAAMTSNDENVKFLIVFCKNVNKHQILQNKYSKV